MVDAAQIETAAAVMAPALLDPLVNGHDVDPALPNLVRGATFSGVFRCAGDDRWVALSSPTTPTGPRCARSSNVPTSTSRLAPTWPRRRRARRRGRHLGGAALAAHHGAAAQAEGLAAGPVQDAEDVAAPAVRHAAWWWRSDQPDLGVIEYAQSPYLMTKTPGRHRRPGPPPGRAHRRGAARVARRRRR